MRALKENDKISKDLNGKKYVGLTFDWDYTKQQVHVSMPGYVNTALVRFKYRTLRKVQDQPYQHVIPNYGAKKQYAERPYTAALLDKYGNTFVQQVTGTFLYYAIEVDITMLVAMSALASEQAIQTQNTMEKVMRFLDYAASQEEAVITYHACDIVLACHSDASYLIKPGARSRAGGHFFLSNDATMPSNNGALLNVENVIKAIMTSGAESEIGTMFINARESVPQILTLIEMGYPQPRTPIKTDNSAAHSVVTNNVQPRRTKETDMQLYWLICRYAQGQFIYLWKPRTANLGDYWTKHHPRSHHKNIHSTVITPMKDLLAFWAIQLASTNRVQAQKKTQLNNIIQIKLMKKMLEQATLGASAD